MPIRAALTGRPAAVAAALAALTGTVILTDAHADIPAVSPGIPCPVLLPTLTPTTRAALAPPRALVPLLSPRPTPPTGVNADAFVPPTADTTYNGTPLIAVPGAAVPGLPGGASPENPLPEPPNCS